MIRNKPIKGSVRKMKKLYVAICLSVTYLFLSAALAFATIDEAKPFKISGYYKNLFMTSKTTDTKEGYVLDINRLRLQLDTKFTDALSANITYDNDVLLNDFSNNSSFDLIRHKNQKELSLWDADRTITDKKHVYYRHSLYRAYMTYHTASFRAIIGKQAIDWSRMRMYHPFDLFNPISPLDIEKDEKMGADALNLEFAPQAFSSINLIYAPDESFDRTSLGLKLSKKIKDYDLSLIGADIKKDMAAGFGFDGYLWEAGLRGELTFTRRDNKRKFLRTIIGMDYNVTPKIYAIAEYFYNGGAEKDTAEFLNSYEFGREALTTRKHLLGAGLEYEISGITKFANYVFYDFEGTSLFYNPELKHNLFTNLDISLGAQLFTGDSDSEFGSYHRLVYAQVKKYF
jgi:hypothetical protein